MTHFFRFLVEGRSDEKLICILMDKIQEEYVQDPPVFKCTRFNGSGTLKKQGGKSNGQKKRGCLLNDLPQQLRGLNRDPANINHASIIIVVDSDENDIEQFRQALEEIGRTNAPNLDCVYAIAVQEIEAWLLGDKDAIYRAYPSAKKSILNKYASQNEVLNGTWETLADVVYKGGNKKLRQSPSYYEIGKQKSEWAERIGREMNLNANVSPSFNRFLNSIRERLNRQ